MLEKDKIRPHTSQVTFETKVWEYDWEYILKGDYLEKMISNCKYPFDRRQVIINNVENRSIVEGYCERKIKKGVIDSYYCVKDFSEEVLGLLHIERDSFGKGYNYSIAELVGIYLCETDYLLHFSGDSYMPSKDHNWIQEAVEIMGKNENIMVANPTWNNRYDEAQKESMDAVDNFYLGLGFSDQCYLIRKKDFNQDIYNEKNPDSQRYPVYGGELFEKRVDAYMRNHHKWRITHKNASYISRNFPRNWFYRKVARDWVVKKPL